MRLAHSTEQYLQSRGPRLSCLERPISPSGKHNGRSRAPLDNLLPICEATTTGPLRLTLNVPDCDSGSCSVTRQSSGRPSQLVPRRAGRRIASWGSLLPRPGSAGGCLTPRVGTGSCRVLDAAQPASVPGPTCSTARSEMMHARQHAVLAMATALLCAKCLAGYNGLLSNATWATLSSMKPASDSYDCERAQSLLLLLVAHKLKRAPGNFNVFASDLPRA